MSLRQQNLGSIIKPGFNPLGAQTTTYTYNLYGWGSQQSGELGLGNTTNYSSPKQVGALTDWSSVSSGGWYVALAVKTDGTLWSWGSNSYGQLGLGVSTALSYSSPKQVGALTNWLQVSASRYHVWAVKTDGTLWSWGNNSGSIGAMGLNNATNYSSPKQVGLLTNWAAVSVSPTNSFALKTNGTIWSCGKGAVGALGTSSTTNVSSPVQIGALTTWSKIVAGGGSSNSSGFAIKTDGTMWSWGYNPEGELGLGNTINRSSPVQIGALTTWLSVAANGYTASAIKTDTTLWCWGYNPNGQIGDNSTTNRSSPVQIGSTGWSSVCAGAASWTAAIKTDGTLWTWGQGAYGSLGLGNTTSYSSPKQVGSLTNWGSVYGGRQFTFALGY